MMRHPQCPQHDTAGHYVAHRKLFYFYPLLVSMQWGCLLHQASIHELFICVTTQQGGKCPPSTGWLSCRAYCLWGSPPTADWKGWQAVISEEVTTQLSLCVRELEKCVRDAERKRTWLSLIETDIKRENGQICPKVSGHSEGPFLSQVNITSSKAWSIKIFFSLVWKKQQY